ncbi:hypothetical protein NPIL_473641 [Nephila pilipes]|uniref:Uncharacterized protein n=1 Tax=Nephila pilipes TaxID=299642 RepID=A0A8X6N1C5_NEPPI|nr:hypothetical protein NPIL_473641 [Nephila pilipes]
MKVIAIVLLMAGAAMAQYASHHAAPVVHQVVQPAAVAASSQGHAYGAHGQHASGYAAHGNAHHADRGHHADRAHAAHGHHNVGAQASHDAHGAQASNYGKYRNVGAYAHDKGTGYEKAYAYDKKAGHHAITADHGAQAAKYGVSDRSAHHNVGAHAQAAHDRSVVTSRCTSRDLDTHTNTKQHYLNCLWMDCYNWNWKKYCFVSSLSHYLLLRLYVKKMKKSK